MGHDGVLRLCVGNCRDIQPQVCSTESSDVLQYTAAVIRGGSTEKDFNASFPDFNCANATCAKTWQELQVNLEVRPAPSIWSLADAPRLLLCCVLAANNNVTSEFYSATAIDKLQRMCAEVDSKSCVQDLLLFLVTDMLEQGGSFPRARFQGIGECQSDRVDLASNGKCFTLKCSVTIRKARALKKAREAIAAEMWQAYASAYRG